MKQNSESTSTSPTRSQGQILLELASDPWLKLTIKNIAKGSGLHHDMQAELFLILGQKEPQYIEQAEEKGYLRFMVVRILHTMHNSTRHPFYKRYIAPSNTVPIGGPGGGTDDDGADTNEDRALAVPDPELDIEEAIDHQRREEALAKTERETDQVTMIIWNRYRKTESAQEIARHYGVPYNYIRRKLREFKEQVRHNYNNHG